MGLKVYLPILTDNLMETMSITQSSHAEDAYSQTVHRYCATSVAGTRTHQRQFQTAEGTTVT